jgi:hypothetical protein
MDSEKSQNKKLMELISGSHSNFHPILVLADIASDTSEDSSVRVAAAKGMMPYLEPQLKAIEVRGNVRQDFGVLRVTMMSEDDDMAGADEGIEE